jgi:hypothetical protein
MYELSTLERTISQTSHRAKKSPRALPREELIDTSIADAKSGDGSRPT